MRRRQLTDERRQRDADGLADDTGTAGGLDTQHEALGALIDGDLLDPVEVAHDVGPFRVGAGGVEPFVEFLAQHEREEGAEQVADDGGIALVVDRPCLEDGLGGAEDLFDIP